MVITIVSVPIIGQIGIARQISQMEMTSRFLLITLIFLGQCKISVQFHQDNKFFRVCSNPTHVDAREKDTQFSWLGSAVALIFDNTPKPESNRSWSWGISRKFGYFIRQNNSD